MKKYIVIRCFDRYFSNLGIYDTMEDARKVMNDDVEAIYNDNKDKWPVCVKRIFNDNADIVMKKDYFSSACDWVIYEV